MAAAQFRASEIGGTDANWTTLELLGLAAGLAMSVPVSAQAETAAERAVREAQQYRGTTITITWEAGLQALDPLNFSGPKWEELTGIKVKVVELPVAKMLMKEMQEYRAGTGAYDAYKRYRRKPLAPLPK